MQGFFRPKNPDKYKGNPTTIVFRSSWEFIAMRSLDINPKIKTWSSEEIIIPYRSPLDNRIHRYFPDLYVETIDGNKYLIEIKPNNQQQAPVLTETKRHKPTKKYLRENIEWIKNNAKWEAAKAYCENRGWNFRIYGEDELNIQRKRK